MIKEAIYFPAPTKNINDSISTLELFHGPTMAFKDFGARFMARIMNYYNQADDTKLTILVATSGDTGSAVANGFYGLETIDVIVLYPSKKISQIQESQIATLDKNIFPIEIEGTFDDCQYLVKQAFLDDNLNEKLKLTSANSINISRLIPQSFYYFYSYGEIQKTAPKIEVVFSVPSGNFGNITAGILADKMGLPVKKWIASTNRNSIFTEFLDTGTFQPRPSVKTISNAMDVGNPSNFERLKSIFHNNLSQFKEKMISFSYNDKETKQAIDDVYKKYGYIMDPHGSVGYLGLKKYLKEMGNQVKGIFLETAHPAKFGEVVEPIIKKEIKIPQQLQKFQNKTKKSLYMKNDFNIFKDFLYNHKS